MPSPADPVAFAVIGVAIRWYALFILSGIAAAIWLVRELARRRGMDPEFPLDLAPWLVFSGIAGARGYYLLLRFDYYRRHPEQAINLRLGGLTIHGALAAGTVVLLVLCRRAGYRVLAWADLIVVGVALGQAIGRWGNWANQEAFGTPTGFPWGVAIDPARRPPAFADATRFHPTFIYESLFDLANAGLLAWIVLRMPRHRFWREGDALWLYLLFYGVARLAIERIRTDSLRIGPLPAAYWVSFGLIAIGAGAFVARHTRWPGHPADPVSPPPESPDAAPPGGSVASGRRDRA